MATSTEGVARIRHKDSGEVFEIWQKELEWDAIGDKLAQVPNVAAQFVTCPPMVF